MIHRALHLIKTMHAMSLLLAFGCLLAGIQNAIGKSGDEVCRDNLKQLDSAKFSMALEQKKFAGEKVELTDLIGSDKYIARTPVCPLGGKYSLNSVGEVPSCTVTNHTLPPQSEWTPKGVYWTDWPHWLGPNRKGVAGSFERAPSQLGSDLKPTWRISIGGGFSSPVISRGKLAYFDENGKKEVLHLLNTATGKEIWKTEIADRASDEWGAGPRSTPLIDGERIYAQSCNGEFRCLNLSNGRVIWGTSFEKDWAVKFLGSKAKEGTAARRGNSGSPVLEGKVIVVPVGSTDGATLVCFDKLNGSVLWKGGNEEAAYSSPQVATLAGTKQVIYLSADSLSGFDFANGKLLWRVPLRTNAKRHTGTPVIFGDNVFVNSHTFGLINFKIVKNANAFEAEQAWINKEMKINLSTPVLVNGFLYSQGPDRNFVCVDASTGKLQWAQPGFGKEVSSVIAIGKKLLVLADDGQLVLLNADPQNYSELGRSQVCGKNWNYPAYAQGKLYVRDARELACFELVK